MFKSFRGQKTVDLLTFWKYVMYHVESNIIVCWPSTYRRFANLMLNNIINYWPD